jgi:hypothetical protein
MASIEKSLRSKGQPMLTAFPQTTFCMTMQGYQKSDPQFELTSIDIERFVLSAEMKRERRKMQNVKLDNPFYDIDDGDDGKLLFSFS